LRHLWSAPALPGVSHFKTSSSFNRIRANSSNQRTTPVWSTPLSSPDCAATQSSRQALLKRAGIPISLARSVAVVRSFTIRSRENPDEKDRENTYWAILCSVLLFRPVDALRMSFMTLGLTPNFCPTKSTSILFGLNFLKGFFGHTKAVHCRRNTTINGGLEEDLHDIVLATAIV
jgi:hypothetical protein